MSVRWASAFAFLALAAAAPREAAGQSAEGAALLDAGYPAPGSFEANLWNSLEAPVEYDVRSYDPRRGTLSRPSLPRHILAAGRVRRYELPRDGRFIVTFEDGRRWRLEAGRDYLIYEGPQGEPLVGELPVPRHVLVTNVGERSVLYELSSADAQWERARRRITLAPGNAHVHNVPMPLACRINPLHDGATVHLDELPSEADGLVLRDYE